MDSLEKLFLKRQSTRKFSDLPVTEEELEKICKLAQFAPSAINAQPYRLYGIAGAKAKEFAVNIQKDGANGWASGCTAFIVIESLPPTELVRGDRVITNNDFIRDDAGILAAYIVLAAEDMDVESCIVGLRDEAGIAKFLSLPEGSSFPLVIALGKPLENHIVREKTRKPFDQLYKLIK